MNANSKQSGCNQVKKSEEVENKMYESNCRLKRDQVQFHQYQNETLKNRNYKKCRICLQSQIISKDKDWKQTDLIDRKINSIISLPCACKQQLGLIHYNCLKLWIKIWLKTKINSHRDDQIQDMQGNNTGLQNDQVISNQRTTNCNFRLNNEKPNQNKGNQSIIKPINFKNIKANTIYPFRCQICRQKIYFDLHFHRKIKKLEEVTTKDFTLLIISILFTIVFLGICINWVIQSGINLYLILFYIFAWIPSFLIAIVIGTLNFTKKQFIVNGIYSRQQIKNRGNSKLKILTQAQNQKQQKININQPKIKQQLNKKQGLQNIKQKGPNINKKLQQHNNMSAKKDPNNSIILNNLLQKQRLQINKNNDNKQKDSQIQCDIKLSQQSSCKAKEQQLQIVIPNQNEIQDRAYD